MKTFMMRKEDVQRDWYVVDAENKALGRLASRIAMILMGKNKPTYTPHVDTGDFIVVTNAEKVKLTGRKAEQKLYHHHSGFIGGLKVRTYAEVLQSKPTEVVELAVRRMLPKTRLGNAMFKKLKVYAGPKHRHQAQQPKVLDF